MLKEIGQKYIHLKKTFVEKNIFGKNNYWSQKICGEKKFCWVKKI